MTKRIDITPAQAQQIERMAARGLNKTDIAFILGMSDRTLRRKKANDKVIDDAMQSGMAKGKLQIGEALYKRAVGGDVRAIRWWEMTRVGYSEKHQQQTIAFNVDDLTDAQIDRLANGEDPKNVIGRM